MNRAERRRAEKEKAKSNKAYIVNANTIQNIKAEATNKAVDVAFVLMLSIPNMVLRDKYGYGKKRLTDFNNYVFELYDSFNKGYVTLDDLTNTLYEETGVKLKLEKTE